MAVLENEGFKDFLVSLLYNWRFEFCLMMGLEVTCSISDQWRSRMANFVTTYLGTFDGHLLVEQNLERGQWCPWVRCMCLSVSQEALIMSCMDGDMMIWYDMIDTVAILVVNDDSPAWARAKDREGGYSWSSPRVRRLKIQPKKLKAGTGKLESSSNGVSSASSLVQQVQAECNSDWAERGFIIIIDNGWGLKMPHLFTIELTVCPTVERFRKLDCFKI